MTAVPQGKIPADVLVKGILERKPIGPFRNLVIDGDVNLDASNYPYPLTVQGCTFTGSFNAAGANFFKTVDLHNCVFEKGANFEGAQVTGHLIVSGSTFGAKAPRDANFHLVRVSGNLRATGVKTTGDMDLGGARIDGNVELQGAQIDGKLSVEVAIIGGNLYAGPLVPDDNPSAPTSTRVGRNAWLGGIKVLGHVDFKAAEIADNLDLLSAEIRCGLSCDQAKIGGSLGMHAANVASKVNLTDARVGVNLICEGAKVGGQLDFSGADVQGEVDLRSIQVASSVRMEGCKVGLNIYLSSADIRGGLAGGVRQDQPLAVGGGMSLSAAKVSGGVDLSGARINTHLGLEDARIEGNLFCVNLAMGKAEDADAPGNVSLARAKISGAVHFDSAHIHGDLQAECAEISGGFFCRAVNKRAVVEGNLLMPAARVSGVIDLSGTRVAKMFSLIGARLEGDLQCVTCKVQEEEHATEMGSGSWIGVDITGMIRLWGTQVADDLNLHGAKIKGMLLAQPWGQSQPRIGGDLYLSSSEFAGDICLNQTRVRKTMEMTGAEVDGNVYVRGSVIGVPPDDDPVADAGSAQPAQAASATSGAPTQADEPAIADAFSAVLAVTRIAGMVDFSGTHVGKDLVLTGAEIDIAFHCGADEGRATRVDGDVALQVARITNFGIDGGLCTGGAIKMNLAQISNLEIENRLPRSIDMEGLTFQTLSVPKNGEERNYVGLLQSSDPFDRTTYVGMERWLKNRGEDDSANRVYRDMRRRQREELTRGLTPLTLRWGVRWLRRALNLAWDTFTLVAVKLSTLLILYFLLVLIGTAWLFADPASVRRREPANSEGKVAAKNPTAEEWNHVKAVAMSLQINVPLIPIRTVEDWRPSENRLTLPGMGGLSYAEYAEAIGLFSSLAVAFLAGGISNKLARRKATEGLGG